MIISTEYGKLHEDTVRAIKVLELEVQRKAPAQKLVVSGPKDVVWSYVDEHPGPTGCPPIFSMRPSGREVELILEGDGTPEHRLALLWGIAIPLGWSPWMKYPIPIMGSTIFHFLGKWGLVGEVLAGAGRGEAVWPSICAAAQVEEDTWEGSAKAERKIQSLLLLQGHMVGPVDGVLGPTTMGVLKALGWGSLPLRTILQRLEEMTVPVVSSGRTVSARLATDAHFSIHTFGSLRARKDVKGATIEVKGVGRLIVDFHTS
jgi:hypothetical protein